MANERPNNVDPADDPFEGLTAVKPAPDIVPGTPADQSNTEGQATNGQAEPSLDNERPAEPATRSSDTPGAAVPTGDVGPAEDPDATWDPHQDESSDGGETWDPEPLESTRKPRVPPDPALGADPNATHTPDETHSVEDIWGDDFDSDEPGQTLKSPAETRLPAQTPRMTAARDAPPDLSGKGYDLLEVLGEGGVGVVYQAVQKSVERKIAVKMIKAGVGQNTKEKEKFIAEALVTGKLDHPNIVPIHDLDTTSDGQPFYTMKMVRGTPWGDVIRDKPLAEDLHILLDVCDAVSFAHSRSVIHRDLKPDNVMLGEFGEVQLMDWGLGAPVSNGGELADLSRTQAAGGTPAYMAPEMVTGEDGPVGIHSDVYLLGAILYQIITGKPPHAGKRVLDVLQNARDNVIEPTESASVLVDIAMTAMRKDPADRHASVHDFKRALLDYQAHAESINLCQRASEDLRRAEEHQDYEAFAEALFGFREALELWDDNSEARTRFVEAQLQYARCALEKGDLDLAASNLDPDHVPHQNLLAEIERAQHRRVIAKRRLKLFRVAAISLTATVVVILTVASIWIYAAKQQAVTAKEEAVIAKEEAIDAKKAAVNAQEAEAEQRELAEIAMTRAQEEEARAVQALADLEQAYADLVEAQEQEKRAWAQARESELVATETRDELAKSGMLLDNSWWVFDSAAARDAQEGAAADIGLPVELAVTLSDGVDLIMVLVPPGDFVMGSPPSEEARSADEHLHRVTHSKAFYLGKFELTEAQWQAVTGKLPPSAVDRDVDPVLPVTGVTVEQISRELLPALQGRAPQGYEFRLPSEAEWEYACRAGMATAFHTGNDKEALDSAGWFLSNSNHRVQPIGRKTPNAFGIYDMHGNASEVCADQYTPGFYLESPVDDPMSAREGDNPIVRGGSILNMAVHCRSAYRSYVYRKNEYPFLGLRLALVPIRDVASSKTQDTVIEDPTNP
ncbi:MAG: SUMF1/EgtB/PvdO family nonheme iron enzyme [Phycisphaerae bacterium]